MNIYFVKFILILIPLIACHLSYTANAHTNISVSPELCQTALLNHKDTLSTFFEAIDQNNIDNLQTTFKNMNWDLQTSYQNGQILLHYASSLGKIDAIQALVYELGVDVNIQESEAGWTSLYYAALHTDLSSRIDTIYTLIKLGANIDVLDNLGHSILHYVENRQPLHFQYSIEQKTKAAELAILLDIHTPQLAKLLQINYHTLYNWVNKYKEKYDIQIQQSHLKKQRAEAIEMFMSGIVIMEIAKKLKRPRRTISNWVRPYRENLKQMRQELRNKAIEMSQSGISTREIAKKLKTPRTTVSYWLFLHNKKNNVKIRQSYDKYKKQEAIEMFKSGMSLSEISKRLKVHRNTVSNWLYPYRNITQTRQKYSQEQREQAIKMVIEDHTKEEETAEKLGIPLGTLFTWIRKHKKEQGLETQKKESYPSELKDEAVEMVTEDKKKIKYVSESMEIPTSTLSRWVRESKTAQKAEPPENDELLKVNTQLINSKIEKVTKPNEIDFDNVPLEAIKKVLQNHRPENVAKEFNVDLELLKLRARQYQYQ